MSRKHRPSAAAAARRRPSTTPPQPATPTATVTNTAQPEVEAGAVQLADVGGSMNARLQQTMNMLYPRGQGSGQNAPTFPTATSGTVSRPIPPLEVISPKRPPLDSLGATGTAIFGGRITSEEYNPDLYWKDAIAIYEQMSRADAQPMAITQLLELPIRRATWDIEPFSDDPKDVEVASFVKSCLFDDMHYETATGRTAHQKWDDTLRHILMMLRFGFMPFEICYRVEDGWVKWARWTPLLPRTIWYWWTDEGNDLAGIRQWTFKNYSYTFIDIPADKLLLFVHRQEGNNTEGVSIFRAAYKHWWMKEQFYKIQAIDLERNAISIPWIQLPENYTTADWQTAQKLLQNMRANEQMGITTPPGWHVEYLNSHEKTAAQIQPAIEHHDLMIARSVLGQFLNLGSTSKGAYNLDASQKATLLCELQAECEYVEDVINTDAIPRLVDYNFTGLEGYPRIKCSKLIAQELDLITDAIEKLCNSQTGPVIEATQQLQDFVSDLLGLPKTARSAVNNTNPGSPNTPDQPDPYAAEDVEPGANAESDNTVDPADLTSDPQAQQADASSAGGSDGGGGSGGGDGGAALSEHDALRYAIDAVERGARFLLGGDGGTGDSDSGAYQLTGGHQPGYQQNRQAGGRFGIGNGEHASAGSGGGSGGGGSHAGGGGSGAKRIERAASGAVKRQAARAKADATAAHAGKLEADGKGGAKGPRAAGGKAGGAKAGKSPEERAAAQHAKKLDAARAKVADLEHQFLALRKAGLEAHDRGDINGWQGHSLNAGFTMEHMDRARQSLARLEGRQLHPAELNHTHEEFLTGKASYTPKGSGRTVQVSAAEAHAYLANPKPAGSQKSSGDGKGSAQTAKSAATAKAPKEDIHATAARLQREQGLPKEVDPKSLPLDHHGFPVVPLLHHVPGMEVTITDHGLEVTKQLAHAYGEHHLGALLSTRTTKGLRDTADQMSIPRTGTREALLSRIVAHVTEGRYSANFGKSSGAKGGDATSMHARHQARITKIEAQLAKARADYAAEAARHGETPKLAELRQTVAALRHALHVERDAMILHDAPATDGGASE